MLCRLHVMSLVAGLLWVASSVHSWLSYDYGYCPKRSTTTTTRLFRSVTNSNSKKRELLLQQLRGGNHVESRVALSSTSENGINSIEPITMPSVSSCEIIGSGRIGSFLATVSTTATTAECKVLGRNDAIDPEKVGHPILIATRNDALAEIVDRCPASRRRDLVFLQNGYLDPFLKQRELLPAVPPADGEDGGGITQVLLYLSIPARGAAPVDGITALNPEGLTAATGVHAQAVAEMLRARGMTCSVVSTRQYRPAMFEKLIWICTYMLVGTAKECKSVGEAGVQYKDLVEQVIQELMEAVTVQEKIVFAAGTVQRLAAYTDVVKDFPCAVKEFEWRNQYFYNLGDDRNACPVHNGLLRECRDKGFLAFELP